MLIVTLVRGWYRARYEIVPGAVRWILDVFKRLTDSLEKAIYAVDEWARFRGTGNPVLNALKAGFGVLWFALTYLFRVYVNLLIEPQVNPVKHFPVVTVSHKIILPFTLTITALFVAPLEPLLGTFLANAIAGFTVFFFRGVGMTSSNTSSSKASPNMSRNFFPMVQVQTATSVVRRLVTSWAKAR